MNPPNQATEAALPAANSPSEGVSSWVSLASTARKILEEKDISQVLRTVCEEACHVLGADRSLIVRIQMDDPPRRQVMSSHNVPQEFIDALQASRSKSFIEGIFEKNQPLVFSDVERESQAFKPETIRQMGIRAICAIPLTAGKEPFGALVLYHLSHREYGPHDLGLAEAFGDLASIAIEKAQLVDSLEARLSEQESLEHAVRYITSGQSLDDIAQNVLAESERVMKTDRCCIILKDSLDGEPRFFAGRGLPEAFREYLENHSAPFYIINRYFGDSPLRGPLIVPDVASSDVLGDASKEFQDRHGNRSLAAFPLEIEEGIFGLLFYYWTKPQVIGEQRIALGEAFAGHVAIAIEKARRAQADRQRAANLATVGAIAKAVGSELDPDQLFEIIFEEIKKIVPFKKCVITFSLSGLNFPRFEWLDESHRNVPSFKGHEDFREWLEREVYGPMRPKNIANLGEIGEKWASERVEGGFKCMLIVPILQKGRCIAHFSLSNDREGTYTLEHEALLSAIAGHLGGAISNAALHQEAKDRAARLEITGKIARAVGSTLKPDELFKTIAREIRRVAPCERFVIGSYDRERNQNRYWHVESEIEIPDYGILGEKDNFWYGDVIDHLRPVNFSDIREIDSPRMKEMAKAGFRSYLIVPILQDDRYIAHISLVSTETNRFTADQIELLTSITGHLSPAIRNAGLYQAAEERASRLTALNDLNQKITENLNLNEVLENIARAAADLLKGDHSRIFLYDEASERIVLRASYGDADHTPDRQDSFRLGEGIVGTMVQSGVQVLIDDVQAHPAWINTRWAKNKNLHSYAGHPLRQGGKIIGAIICLSMNRGAFVQEDLDLLGALASQALVAIDNARLHEEAQRSRKFLESVVTDSADAIIIVDPDRKIILWNSGAESLYGYAKEEVLGRHVNMIIPEKDREETNRINRKMLEEGIPVAVEVERVSKDGRVIPVSMTLSPVKREDGTLIANAGIHRDLTERHRAEEALRQSEEKFRSLVEFAGDTIFVHDSSGKLLDVNQQACESLGYTRDELMALSVQDIEVSFESTHHSKKWKAMELDETLTVEGAHRRKDGTEFPVEMRLGKFVLDGKDLFVGLIRDMTEHKEAEDRVLRAMAEAEAASQAKSEFLSNMSHELRSPLNSVVGFSDLLIRDSSDEMTLKLAPKIKESGEYLAKLIEDLLDFDRIESGKVKLEVEDISINDLVKNVVEARAPQLTEGHSLEIHLNPSCGTLSCDPTRISQVLINLLDNAVKYSPGGGAIHIRTDARPDEIWISVKDDGLGMSPEELEVIFERFRQLESGYMRRSGGLGIGLSLIRELLGLHGGRIWVESEKGKGAIFTFALPRALPGGPEKGGTGADSRDTLAAAASPWDKKSVLIMDDLEHYHIYMRLLMSGAERVLSAYAGEEGVETAARERPDLILVDLRMPVMDGFEAIEGLRKNPLTREIPTLAVTAQVMEEDRGRSLQAGADGFVTKPIDIDALKKEVARVLGARG